MCISIYGLRIRTIYKKRYYLIYIIRVIYSNWYYKYLEFTNCYVGIIQGRWQIAICIVIYVAERRVCNERLIVWTVTDNVSTHPHSAVFAPGLRQPLLLHFLSWLRLQSVTSTPIRTHPVLTCRPVGEHLYAAHRLPRAFQDKAVNYQSCQNFCPSKSGSQFLIIKTFSMLSRLPLLPLTTNL